MWGDLVGLAFLASLNPVLLAFILLVISRPRPVQNLLAFWAGCLAVNVPIFLASLLAAHLIPSFSELARDLTTPNPDSGVQPLQTGTGVVALIIAVLMAVRMWSKKRVKQPAPVGSGSDSSVLVADADSAPGPSPRPGRIRGLTESIGARFRRLLSFVHDAWDNGALWVSVAFGLIYLPPPPLVLLIITMIVGSGATIGVQVAAVGVFIFVMLAVFELVLVSYLISPARTQAVLRPVHDWGLTHRLHVLITLFAVVGVWQFVTGIGIV